MKKNILRYAATVAAIAAIACSKDDAANPGTPENHDTATPFTISASIDDGADTRISMDDDGTTKIGLRWKSGDKIYVINSEAAGFTSSGTLYTFTVSDASISADGKNAEFKAPSNYPAGATPMYAIHKGNVPYVHFNPTNVSGTGYANQSTLPDNYLLYAKYDGETKKLAFKPISALLKLKVTLPAGVSGTLSNIRIGAADGSEIFYTGSSNITSGTAVRSVSWLKNQVLFSASSQIAENTETELLFVLNPGTEPNGQPLEIDLIIGNTVCSTTIKGGVLEAGKCYPLTLGAAKWTVVGKIYEDGTGAESSPYQIASEANLKALARAVRAGVSYSFPSYKYFRLMKDIPVTTSEADPWLPVGVESTSFEGHFDGNSRTVSGKLYLSDKDGGYLGFFGRVSSGSIQNLTIASEIVYKGSRNGQLFIGGIAGNSSAPITRCTHSGAITVENTVNDIGVYVGGIAGRSNQNITDCTQQGEIITVNAPKATVFTGGIAGHFYGSSSEMHTSRNESDITAKGRTSNTYAGALVGLNEGKVFECSTFLDPGLTVTENGTPQDPVKAVGNDKALETCLEHPAQ